MLVVCKVGSLLKRAENFLRLFAYVFLYEWEKAYDGSDFKILGIYFLRGICNLNYLTAVNQLKGLCQFETNTPSLSTNCLGILIEIN